MDKVSFFFKYFLDVCLLFLKWSNKLSSFPFIRLHYDFSFYGWSLPRIIYNNLFLNVRTVIFKIITRTDLRIEKRQPSDCVIADAQIFIKIPLGQDLPHRTRKPHREIDLHAEGAKTRGQSFQKSKRQNSLYGSVRPYKKRREEKDGRQCEQL